MSWAGRQRAFVIAVAALGALAGLLILGISIFYETPTCTDRKQNQNEAGVDCGGMCTTLCSSQVSSAPVVRFARAIEPQPGRTDVIAYIDNPNGNAEAKAAPFLLEVYDSSRSLIAKKTVTVDLPSAMTMPLYLADIAPRGSVASQVFLSPVTDSIEWTIAGERPVLPLVEDVTIAEGEKPRISATLRNQLARAVYNTTLVAVVFDASGNAMAGSQTLVPMLPSQGESPLVFTWNAPFESPAARVEILPVAKIGNRAP